MAYARKKRLHARVLVHPLFGVGKDFVLDGIFSEEIDSKNVLIFKSINGKRALAITLAVREGRAILSSDLTVSKIYKIFQVWDTETLLLHF